MTGAQLPLYVILHVIMMTSFSCTTPEADRFIEQRVSFAGRDKITSKDYNVTITKMTMIIKDQRLVQIKNN